MCANHNKFSPQLVARALEFIRASRKYDSFFECAIYLFVDYPPVFYFYRYFSTGFIYIDFWAFLCYFLNDLLS